MRPPPGEPTIGSISPPIGTAYCNVFSTDSLGNGRRETSAWSGAFDAVPLPDSSGLLVGGFHDLSWNLYRYPVDSAAREDRFTLDSGPPPAQWAWASGSRKRRGQGRGRAVPSPADPGFRRRGAAFVPGYGGAQGISFLMSDLLGDNLVYGSIGSFQGRRLGSVFANISASTIYVNQQRRLNWGLGRVPHQKPELRGRPGRGL